MPVVHICSGEQRLCMAVIIQAIKDIHYTAKKKKALGRKLPQYSTRDAKKWVLSDSTEPFSFLWCVEHAFSDIYDSLDIDNLRKNILSTRLLCVSPTLYRPRRNMGPGRKHLSLYL